MSLLLPHSVFIHIPKTGGTWVREAMKRSGIPISPLKCAWHNDHMITSGPNQGQLLQQGHVCWHNRLRDIDAAGRLTFSFVRHPVSLCISHWQYKQRVGWKMHNESDAALRADTIEEFLEKVLVRSAGRGWVTSMYRMFLTEQERRVDFIGAQEHLADDLVTALRVAGEEFDEAALRATPRQNTTGAHSLVVLPRDLLDRLMEAERDAIRDYGYEGYPLECACV
jgi:hypothetical protein